MITSAPSAIKSELFSNRTRHGEVPAFGIHLHAGFAVAVPAAGKLAFEENLKSGAGGRNLNVGRRQMCENIGGHIVHLTVSQAVVNVNPDDAALDGKNESYAAEQIFFRTVEGFLQTAPCCRVRRGRLLGVVGIIWDFAVTSCLFIFFQPPTYPLVDTYMLIRARLGRITGGQGGL